MKNKMYKNFYIIIISILIFSCANPEAESDAQIDSSIDFISTDVVPIDTESNMVDTESDTGIHDIVCDPIIMDTYDTDTYYYPDYPSGPFGFKEAMCPHVDKLVFITDGDTIHNICLPNDSGKEVCLSDFRSKDILFVDFVSLYYKGDCQYTAMFAEESLNDIKELCGIDASWITVLMAGKQNHFPTIEEGKEWRNIGKGTDPILVDVNGFFGRRALLDRWPSSPERSVPLVFAVDTKTMKIDMTYIGWMTQNFGYMYDMWIQYVCDSLTAAREERNF